MFPKISVIIPVYNAEMYIGKCIESIQAQTFTDWQLILVDDGSKDNSLEVCKEYASYDKRIFVMHQSNSGAGMARNAGIEQAVGEYVVFVDSDDYVSPDYLNLLSRHNEDLVYIDIEAISESGKVLRKEYMSRYRGLAKEDFIRAQMTGKINWGGVRKAVRRSLLNNYSIRYSNTRVGEEALLSFKELHYARSYSFIDQVVYYYIQRDDSLSHIKQDDGWGDVSILMRNELIKEGLYEQYADTANAFILAAAACSAFNLCNNYNYKEYRQKVQARRKKLFADLDSDYPIDFKHIKITVLVVAILLKYNLTNLIWLTSKIR